MNRLAEEAAYFGAVEDGARSRDDEIERLQKQIMILREALGQLSLYVAHNGDDWVKIQALKALAATQDLSGLILCDAEPAAWLDFHSRSEEPLSVGFDKPECIKSFNTDVVWREPLYQARKAK